MTTPAGGPPTGQASGTSSVPPPVPGAGPSAGYPPPGDRETDGPRARHDPPQRLAPAEIAALGRTGFAERCDVYERGRPGYPDEVVAHLESVAGLGPGTTVVDLAAGTGKLTRQLVATGARSLAVEPSAAMRDVCRRALPDVPVVAARAEDLPLAGACADLVTVAQAFHWFDAARALAEMGRVLRPGGTVALLWNERDVRVPWMAELDDLMQWGRRGPYERAASFQPVLDGSDWFEPSESARFAWADPTDRQGVTALVASRSYVNVMDEDERDVLLARVAELAAGLSEPIAVPYVTNVFTARRRRV